MKSHQQGNCEPVSETTTRRNYLLIFLAVCFVFTFAYTELIPRALLLFSNIMGFLIEQTLTFFRPLIVSELSKESLFKHIE